MPEAQRHLQRRGSSSTSSSTGTQQQKAEKLRIERAGGLKPENEPIKGLL
jgi:hypothetical protein